MLNWKICGMREATNIQAVASLLPDLMGFIFYPFSKRFVGENWQLPSLPATIRKVGVFVNEKLDCILEKIQKYHLDYLQLHGEEDAVFCQALKKLMQLPIVKAFSVGESFDFGLMEPYLPVVDAFLLDTKGEQRGGNGIPFDWKILKSYPYQKPLWISGGISLENTPLLLNFLEQHSNIPVQVLDLNSCFEVVPAYKDVEKLKTWKNHIFKPFCQKNDEAKNCYKEQ